MENFNYNKYLKYKFKHSQLEKMIGGLIEEINKDIPEINDQNINLNGIQKIGKGGFGIIGLVNNTTFGNIAIKLIHNFHSCNDAKKESNIHNKIYMIYNKLRNHMNTNSFNNLHITKPFSYHNSRQLVKIDDEMIEIYCYYAMEYAEPIDIIENKFGDIPIQLHINKTVQGFLENQEFRGYFHKDINDMIRKIKLLYPNISMPQIDTEIIESIGIAVGIAIFGARYNPLDYQFMISKINNQFKIVAFDYGLFESYDATEFATKLNDIYDGLVANPYIGEFLFDANLTDAFLIGVARAVKAISVINGSNYVIDNFKLLYDKIINDEFYKHTENVGSVIEQIIK